MRKLAAWSVALIIGAALAWGIGRWRAALAPAVPSVVDIGFAQAMSHHHQQAILMSQLMLDGRPTPLANLAKQIAGSQQYELGQMHGWLALWGQPLAPLKPPMDWLLVGARPPDAELRQYLLACKTAPSGMAGLATMAQLEQLRRIDGQARDALFVQLMRAHHEGAMPMARHAAGESTLPAVKRLSKEMLREQSVELHHLQRLGALLQQPISGAH